METITFSERYADHKHIIQIETKFVAQYSIRLITSRPRTSLCKVSRMFFQTTGVRSVASSLSCHEERVKPRVTRPPCIERRIPAGPAVASSVTRTSEPIVSCYSGSISLGWLMLQQSTIFKRQPKHIGLTSNKQRSKRKINLNLTLSILKYFHFFNLAFVISYNFLHVCASRYILNN